MDVGGPVAMFRHECVGFRTRSRYRRAALTLPIGIVDAVLGKYLALAGFFTVALATNFVHVLTLSWLGDPDVGLLFANFLGWWFLGSGFVGLCLAASVLVGQLAVAFCSGVLLFCGAFTLVAVNGLEVLEPFNRGSFSVGSAVVSLAGVLEGLAVAVFFLSMRRWRAGEGSRVTRDVLTVVLPSLLPSMLAVLRSVQAWIATCR